MMDKLIFGFYALMFLAVGGYIANIYKMVTYGFVIAEWGGMQVARIIGIFVAPLGALLGFF
ncbi:hypothetical protein [Yersinia sp. 2545 StPb PI]|uniref:hypothetical protein n=1 Tax=Yersinia sp. 2545 StPb PI TaxID=3117410 RepID=UPI0029B172DA|nr:hypothetical protein [Yersinia enterocolitica]HEI6761396.1 hypothetical protein [Yersinia enterocolitica]HEI6868299.1 hypothetical protein [Yersinia enterocolitica]